MNTFDTDTATTVEDPGTYESVENLSTDQQLENADNETSLTTLGGESTYYKGNLSEDATLPWKISVTYTLDGKTVSPDELVGASGKFDIDLKIDGLDDDSATANFVKSFLVQAQGTFSNDTFQLDEAPKGTIAQVGNNTLVTYMPLPGENGDWHITGTAKNFTYSGWQISCLPIALDVNVHDYDTSELADAATELKDDTQQLADGGTQLKEALGLITAGAKSAHSGST